MAITQVGDYIFAPDNPLDADVAIVLGMSDWRRPVMRAVELYQDGRVRRLLFTGGYNSKIEATEATEMAAVALASGVPEADILVEPRATHTDQNMTFSKELLESSIGLAELRSILLVTIHYHIRRAIIAARRQFPARSRSDGSATRAGIIHRRIGAIPRMGGNTSGQRSARSKSITTSRCAKVRTGRHDARRRVWREG